MGWNPLSENWTSASGGKGNSYNYFDTGTEDWHQVWISDSGSFIHFVGEARDGGIFFTAETTNAADGDISPDGELLATSEIDGMVRLWDPHRKRDNLQKSFQLGPPGGSFNRVVFTPDGRHLVTANANGTVYVLRLKEWSAK